MKKREFLATLAVMAALGMTACGTKELELITNQVEVELGSELDTAVATYVADEKIAAEATVDFSAVDMSKVGTYSAVVTYKDQTAGFDVVVVDTTAPEVEVAKKVVATAGEPLYVKDIITGITELGGEVEVTFSEPENEIEADLEGTEAVEGTEAAEDTEMAEGPTEEAGDIEALDATETKEGTESAVDATETAEPEAEFVLNDVICSNAYVIYPETGEYDNTLTITDASGNSTEVTVHIVVGDAPEFSGIEDITVTVGTEADEIDYLDGVTATDSNGNDITANIVCDSAAVDLEAAGEYEITYTVTDENGFTATKTATVTVEEKSGKKSDSKKNDSGKTDSKTDSSKKNNISTSGNSNAASAGTSGNSNASDASSSSGNNSNSGNSNGGNNTSGDTGNASTPSTDNSSNTSTPSADNSGSTTTPSTPAPAPETPSTPSADTGSSSGGEMAVPDDALNDPVFDPSTNPPRDDELGGSGWHVVENQP